jgi:hypothetical protein
MANTLTTKEALTIRLGADLTAPIDTKFTPITGLNLLLQDIQLLLLTLPGERVNRPTFGCGLRHLIWENMDVAETAGSSIIRAALELFESRINVIDVSAESNINTGLITFNIQFVVNSTDQKVNLVFPLRTSTDLSFA